MVSLPTLKSVILILLHESADASYTEIDLSDGAMWDQFGAAQSYREQTMAYVRYSLGIDAVQPAVTNRIILNFEVIGAALRASYSLGMSERPYLYHLYLGPA